MADNEGLIEMLRGIIVACDTKVKEGEKAKRHLMAAKAHLEVLLSDSDDVVAESSAEFAVRAFGSDNVLSVGEITDRMKNLGWRSSSAKPVGVVAGLLKRDARFRRLARGIYELKAESEVHMNGHAGSFDSSDVSSMAPET